MKAGTSGGESKKTSMVIIKEREYPGLLFILYMPAFIILFFDSGFIIKYTVDKSPGDFIGKK